MKFPKGATEKSHAASMKRFLLTSFVEMTGLLQCLQYRTIINPDIPTKAGCIIVDARFIARSLLSRQGWKRLCGGEHRLRCVRAAGLPWRRGDQWGATSAALAGQKRGAAAFERTARPQGTSGATPAS